MTFIRKLASACCSLSLVTGMANAAESPPGGNPHPVQSASTSGVSGGPRLLPIPLSMDAEEDPEGVVRITDARSPDGSLEAPGSGDDGGSPLVRGTDKAPRTRLPNALPEFRETTAPALSKSSREKGDETRESAEPPLLELLPLSPRSTFVHAETLPLLEIPSLAELGDAEQGCEGHVVDLAYQEDGEGSEPAPVAHRPVDEVRNDHQSAIPIVELLGPEPSLLAAHSPSSPPAPPVALDRQIIPVPDESIEEDVSELAAAKPPVEPSPLPLPPVAGQRTVRGPVPEGLSAPPFLPPVATTPRPAPLPEGLDLTPIPGADSLPAERDGLIVPRMASSQPEAPARQPPPTGQELPPVPEMPGEAGERDQLTARRLALLHQPLTEVALGPVSAPELEPENLALLTIGQYPPIVVYEGAWVETRPVRYPIAFTFQPLYFEEANLERCGRGHGIIQPFVSAAAFLGNTITLPYHAALVHPKTCVLPPGDCPTCHRFPNNVRVHRGDHLSATLLQGAVVVGFIFLLM